MEIHKRKCFLQEKVAAWSERIKEETGEDKASLLGLVTLVKFSIYGIVLKE